MAFHINFKLYHKILFNSYLIIMKSFKLYLFSLKRNIFPLIFMSFILCLLLFSASNISATKHGLNLWVNSVVPSLFSFFSSYRTIKLYKCSKHYWKKIG